MANDYLSVTVQYVGLNTVHRTSALSCPRTEQLTRTASIHTPGSWSTSFETLLRNKDKLNCNASTLNSREGTGLIEFLWHLPFPWHDKMDTMLPMLRHTGTIATTRPYHSYDTLAPMFRHDGTTVTTLRYHLRHTATTITKRWYTSRWYRCYDTSVPLLRYTGIIVTTRWYHWYDMLVPLLWHTSIIVTTRWYHCYDMLVPLLRHAGTAVTTY